MISKRLKERLANDQPLQGARVVYRVTGGAPTERLDQSVVLDGDGRVRWQREDQLDPRAAATGETVWSQTDMRDAFAVLAESFDALTVPQDARFQPDTLVASISMEMADQVEHRYLPAGALEGKGLQNLEALRRLIERLEALFP